MLLRRVQYPVKGPLTFDCPPDVFCPGVKIECVEVDRVVSTAHVCHNLTEEEREEILSELARRIGEKIVQVVGVRSCVTSPLDEGRVVTLELLEAPNELYGYGSDLTLIARLWEVRR